MKQAIVKGGAGFDGPGEAASGAALFFTNSIQHPGQDFFVFEHFPVFQLRRARIDL